MKIDTCLRAVSLLLALLSTSAVADGTLIKPQCLIKSELRGVKSGPAFTNGLQLTS